MILLFKNVLRYTFAFLIAGHSIGQHLENEKIKNPFLGIIPTNTPQLLEPGIISTSLSNYNATFSPNGKEFYYTSEATNKGYITVMFLGADNVWSAPAIANFSGVFSDYDPLISPDGTKLYFSSERPVKSDGESNGTHVWCMDRKGDSWGEPYFIALSDQGDYHSSITNNGDIYYNIWRDGKIYKATKTDTGFISSELPEIINSGRDGGDAFISPNEDYLIYRAYYDDGFGRGDLYISFKINEQWTKPENLGENINSKAREMCPTVTTDGKIFLFASQRVSEADPGKSLIEIENKMHTFENGNLNIYYMSADFINEMKKKHVKSK